MKSPEFAILSPEIVADILQKISEIQALLPDEVALQPSDRQKLLKIGRKTTQFVQLTIDVTDRNPNLVPAYIDHGSMETNYQVYNQMLTIVSSVRQLERKVTDRMLGSGSSATTQSLSCYNAIKDASRNNVPGAHSTFEMLQHMFKAVKRKSGSVPPETDSGEVFS